MAIEPVLEAVIRDAVARALSEDRASEDATTLAVIDPGLYGHGRFVAKEAGVACGVGVAAAVFRYLGAGPEAITQLVDEGEWFERGRAVALVSCRVATMLQGERTALNFIQHLSGIATLTRAYVDAVAGTKAMILDTRKTTPGLRDLEKYAVRCGGGTNHRRDLGAMAMIKDNHREALAREGRSLLDGVAAIRRRSPGVPVEIEIDHLAQLEAALDAHPEWILLDNMTANEIAEAVRRTAGRAKLEASGGVTFETVRDIAEAGVDAISVGALTHSAPALDVSLDLSF